MSWTCLGNTSKSRTTGYLSRTSTRCKRITSLGRIFSIVCQRCIPAIWRGMNESPKRVGSVDCPLMSQGLDCPHCRPSRFEIAARCTNGRFGEAAPQRWRRSINAGICRSLQHAGRAGSCHSPRSQTDLITMPEADLYIPRVRPRTRLQNPLNSSGFVSPYGSPLISAWFSTLE